MSVAEPEARVAAGSEASDAGPAEQRYYPVFLDLRGRVALVVGGGWVAEEKTRGLLAAGARVRLVSPRLEPPLRELVAVDDRVEHRGRDFDESDLDGVVLVFAERLGEGAERRIFDAADRRGLFVNVQDRVPRCSFIAASVVRRGDLQVAISTSGSAPALAVRLRQRLERELGPEIAEFLALARRARGPLAESVPDFDERRRRWYALVDSEVMGLLAAGRSELAERRLAEILGVEPEPATR